MSYYVQRKSKLRFLRPDFWENSSVPEIENTLKTILNEKGITPFIEDVSGQRKSIDYFCTSYLYKNLKYLSEKPIEDLILEVIESNISDIAQFIFDNNAVSILVYKDFDSPIFSYEEDGEVKEVKGLEVTFQAGMYHWNEYSFEHKKDLHECYYYVSSFGEY